MIPLVREMVEEAARKRGVDPEKVLIKCRSPRVVYARAEVAKLLDARGYSLPRIGAALGGHDHTTVFYYLGRAKKRLKPEPTWPPMKKRRWRAPKVRHLLFIRKPPGDRTLYLVPYAGADMTKYAWRKRA